MAIKLVKSREPGATPALLVKDIISLGKRHVDVAKNSVFYNERRVNFVVADTIRHCNNFLGMSGNFKNGCLYREKGLAEFWKKSNGEQVVCDHAIPVVALVKQHLKDDVAIKRLIFSPVVRISKKSNDELTAMGNAKSGEEKGLPLSRYSLAKIKILTHMGEEVDPSTWTDKDHWNLVCKTEELKDVLRELEITP